MDRRTDAAQAAGRLLVLLTVLVALLGCGLAGTAGPARSVAPAIGQPPAGTSAWSEGSVATRAAAVVAPVVGGELAVVQPTATTAAAAVPVLPAVVPGAPVLPARVVLLLGHLPRPPDTAGSADVLDALRGRAPPATTGT